MVSWPCHAMSTWLEASVRKLPRNSALHASGSTRVPVDAIAATDAGVSFGVEPLEAVLGGYIVNL